MGLGELNERDYQYLLTCAAEHVEYFSPEIISINAMKVFNVGIKAFSMQELDQARIHFLQTLQLDPSNGLVVWNLARLAIQFAAKRENVQEYYHIAMKKIRNRNLRRRIKRELGVYNDTGTGSILPVQL